MAGVMAQVLADRGSSALVFRGEDGLDELTTTGRSRVWVVREGATTSDGDAEEVGSDPGRPEALRGRGRAYNASVARDVLAGERGPSATPSCSTPRPRSSRCSQTDEPLAEQLRAGMQTAAAAVDEGEAAALLQRWVEESARLAGR
jgi:anthranilate phosphoribosyltransferase